MQWLKAAWRAGPSKACSWKPNWSDRRTEKGQTHRHTYRKAGIGQSTLIPMKEHPLPHYPGTSTPLCFPGGEVSRSQEEVSVGEQSQTANLWEGEAAVNAPSLYTLSILTHRPEE